MAPREPAVDGSQTGHTGTDHQDLGGRYFAGGGDLTGEEATELVGGFDHGAITTDVGHGGEGVEGLGTGDPRHHVHRHHIDVALGQLLDQLGVLGRPDEAHQSGTILNLCDLGIGRRVDLEDKVGLPDARHHAGTGSLEGGIIEAGQLAGTGLDGDLEAELFQLLDGGRGRCDPGLTGETLSRYSNLHDYSLMVNKQSLPSLSCLSGQGMIKVQVTGPLL